MDQSSIIPSEKPSLFDQLSKLDKQAIIRPTNPPAGIAGFLVDIILDDAIELTSDITDHYVEDNTAIQDQIALHPEQIMVRGLVAELSNGRPAQTTPVPTQDALPLNPALTPELAPQAEQTLDEMITTGRSSEESSALLEANSLYDYFNNRSSQQPNQSKQTKAFLYFYALWKGRQLFSVETPWGIMTNVAILTLRQEQPENTDGESEVRMTLKKIRTATELATVDGQLAGRSALQMDPVTKNGNAGQDPQTPAEKQSWLYKMLHPTIR